MRRKFRFCIDRGGTFTDVYAILPDNSIRVMKLLSQDQANYPDAPSESIRRIIGEFMNGKPLPPDQQIDGRLIDYIRMASTLSTNALLERKGERMALVVTKGFKDILRIGNQCRKELFKLQLTCLDNLFEAVVEADERVVLHRKDCPTDASHPVVNTISMDKVEIWQPLNTDALRADLEILFNKGMRSLAVLLLFSYIYPEHEKMVEKIAREVGFQHVSLSSQVQPMIRAVPRGFTACADAYLAPVTRRYLDMFTSAFTQLSANQLYFMLSDGGLKPSHEYRGTNSIISGPAAGYNGISMAEAECGGMPIIGFDMGGTSTDVSRFAGKFEHVFETTVAGISIQSPMLDIQTVAAGGGSRLFFRNGFFVVGPESSGAFPGPLCYKNGGYLSLTDANLVLGRLLSEYFPKVFGLDRNQPLDYEASKAGFRDLQLEVNAYMAHAGLPQKTIEEIALGFINVANEAMCRPIRALTQEKGFDTRDHVLACFGGAGGQHACAVAKLLKIKKVFIHKYASVFSAYGLSGADVVHDLQEPCSAPYKTEHFPFFDYKLDSLASKVTSKLISMGFSHKDITLTYFLHMRYEGTDFALMTTPSQKTVDTPATEHGDFLEAFSKTYQKLFGFMLSGRDIYVDNVRVRGVGKTKNTVPTGQLTSAEECVEQAYLLSSAALKTVSCYFDGGFQETPVYEMNNLHPACIIAGPAIITGLYSCIVVENHCCCEITPAGNIIIHVSEQREEPRLDDVADPIHLTIFSHRFTSIAEQMGRTLRRIAVSTNIKERLDFSCALFSADGGLVVNAPHIPVHLGAMQETIACLLRHADGKFQNGDVYLCNYPQAGGSHLPDLTVITPVFYNGSEQPVFFVANRGHHADIGGLVPGSMPSHSFTLEQEGAIFIFTKIVAGGIFNEEGARQLLEAPARVPGCSGCRNMSDCISDLHAQVAANKKGIDLTIELIKQCGLEAVQAQMDHIRTNAEWAVRQLMRNIGKASFRKGRKRLQAVDYMDDGTPIKLAVTINEETGDTTFDFSGTGLQVYGNLNAPRAVTTAAVLYCLRCLVDDDIPLNQGCLVPIRIEIPDGSLLNPSATAAVVGGNVLTSQRIVDVILKCFEACAASQGCMNNVSFGDDTFGYYETVAGGSGAGPGWHGIDGVQTHMTNTRITDPEILERRCPVVLLQFQIRTGSGGQGKYKGGNGLVREYYFRKPLKLSVLTDRRVFAPYGLFGGKPGATGVNTLVFCDGRSVNLGSKASADVIAGNRLIIQTPGGGAWGKMQ